MCPLSLVRIEYGGAELQDPKKGPQEMTLQDRGIKFIAHLTGIPFIPALQL